MSLQPISSNVSGVPAGYDNPQVKAVQMASEPHVSRNGQGATRQVRPETVALSAQEDTHTMKQVNMTYDVHGKVHFSFMDTQGTVIFQTPSELADKMNQPQ